MNIIAYILYIYTSIYEQLSLSGMYLSVFCGCLIFIFNAISRNTDFL